MSKIFDYKNFKLSENADNSPLLQKESDLKKQIATLQQQLLTVQQQILSSQQQALQQPGAAPLPITPQLSENEVHNLPDFHILDYGFETEGFWIGLTEDTENDIVVPTSVFGDFIKKWAKENSTKEELRPFYELDEAGADEDGYAVKGHYFDYYRFWDHCDNTTQRDIIKEYLKTDYHNDRKRFNN